VQIWSREIRPSPVVKKTVVLDLNQPVAFLVDEPATDGEFENRLWCGSAEFQIYLPNRGMDLEFWVVFSDFIPECAKMRDAPCKGRERERHPSFLRGRVVVVRKGPRRHRGDNSGTWMNGGG
jgi:hypothetical protein